MTKPTVLVSLIGHQPMPTLLAMRHLKPDKLVLLTSNDERINTIRNNLEHLASEIIVATSEVNLEERKIEVLNATPVDPWNMLSIGKRLAHVLRREQDAKLICDVTGGTKAMSIGLAQVAREWNAEIIYIDSDTLNTRMWRYQFAESNLILCENSPESIPAIVNIQDLFHSYLGRKVLEYKPSNRSNDPNDKGPWFERDVKAGFQPLVDCLEQSVVVSGKEEADLVLRIKNRFAIVECKATKTFNMKGIQQLNNMASERYLGTYTGKILAVSLTEKTSLSDDVKKIAEQHSIVILPLHDWDGSEDRVYEWSVKERVDFQAAIDKVFGKL